MYIHPVTAVMDAHREELYCIIMQYEPYEAAEIIEEEFELSAWDAEEIVTRLMEGL